MSLFENIVSLFHGNFVILRPIFAVWSQREAEDVSYNHQD